MFDNDIKWRELGKGVLFILSYFLGGNLLALLFSLLFHSLKLNKYIGVAEILVYLIIAGTYIYIFRKDLKKDLKKFKKDYKKDLKIAFKYYIRGIFIMIVSNLLIASLLKIGKSVNELQNIANLKREPVVQFLLIILLAPLIEELVFRFSFRNMSKDVAKFSFTTGILFGAVHVISSLGNPLAILYLIPYSAMGIALGYAYKKTDTIFSSFTLHVIHNSITLMIIIFGIIGGAV